MNELPWAANYRASFRQLPPEEERNWVYLLTQKCKGASDAELNSVMDSLCDTWPAGTQRPTVRDFINAVWAMRKSKHTESGAQVALTEFEESEKHRVWLLLQEIYQWGLCVPREGQKAWDQIWIRITDRQNSNAQRLKLYGAAAGVGFDRSLLSWKFKSSDGSEDGL